jgi:putative intracellular protease/amidase
MDAARHDAPATAELKADLREAYERGRRDERSLRRRHPVLMTFLFIAAAVGAIVMGLAAANGSFTRAGGVVDQNLTTAANRAEPAVRDAAASAGQSLKDAGAKVSDKTAEAAH